ncbi:MAG: phosphatidylinositol-specific phospholipase C/glycerophosphodiester phosphodiesterase family protein [Flammeovirgaceae bacterium]|nr:phosphatidylinositol-specific phospholipase C/glycerophosphodiester phosphodiesterase family protein [Flammeovirgaceae bacterium]
MDKGAFLILLFLFSGIHLSNGQTSVTPLTNAHSHNDYHQNEPLSGALKNGFTSVEADVLLIDGDLYVAHNKPIGKNNLPTLETLYLKPLYERITSNNGKVYPHYEGVFYLMIDFKTDANKTYEKLEEILEKYSNILTRWENGKILHGPVEIFISGNRPIATVSAQKERLVSLDGRPEDLGKNISPELMPVISQNFNTILKWNGKKEIKKSELAKLNTLVKQVHAEGKKLRLWASPDTLIGWEVLYHAGVDLINTDDQKGLRKFLLSQKDE